MNDEKKRKKSFRTYIYKARLSRCCARAALPLRLMQRLPAMLPLQFLLRQARSGPELLGTGTQCMWNVRTPAATDPWYIAFTLQLIAPPAFAVHSVGDVLICDLQVAALFTPISTYAISSGSLGGRWVCRPPQHGW